MENDDKPLLEKLRKSLERSPFVMLGLAGHPALSEPMTAKFDDQTFPEALFFYLRGDNRLMRALADAGPDAVATFASKDHQVFATLSGRVTPNNDPNLVDRFWSNGVAAWFEGGKKDPMLQLLRMDVHHAEIWEADVSMAGKLKLMFGGEVQRSEFDSKHTHAVL